MHTTYTQPSAFDVKLEPIAIENLGGLQAFAHGEYDGKWILFGGRLDGLHQRQPFASFDVAGHNNQIVIIDINTGKSQKRSLSELPKNLSEPLSSTNMQFIQEDDVLFLIGGYGYSNTEGDHTTYNTLTAVDLPTLVHAIENQSPILPAFKQITHPKLQVTGGYLGKIDDIFFLVGGQKFIGRYNPMGPNHGPGFIQEYTNAVRKFRINNASDLSIELLDEWVDDYAFHRRDYNLGAKINSDGSEGLTLFSGVFRPDVDLPYLDCIHISKNSFEIQPNFDQLFNQYHTAHVPLYDSTMQDMHTLFFGGIGLYFLKNGTLTKDDNVPFVNTISLVTLDKEGQMTESALNATMPNLMGASAEFFIADDIETYRNGVIKLNTITTDTTMIGYIYGGIHSSQANIFFINDGSQSVASPTLFKVYLIKNKLSVTKNDRIHYNDFNVYPNPVKHALHIDFNVINPTPMTIFIQDIEGRVLLKQEVDNVRVGNNSITVPTDTLPQQTFIVSISDGKHLIAKKIIR